MTATEPTIYQEIRRRVLSLQPGDHTPAAWEAFYEEMSATLEQVPAGERHRTWRQTSVLLDVRFRRRAPRVLRQLAKLRATMTANDRAAQFDQFYERVLGLLGQDAVTPHGYAARLDSLDSTALWGRVAELGRRLEAEGLSWFATSGTLLGIVRHGDVLPHDDDVDLCVLLDGHDEGSAAEAWLRARTALADLIRPQELHRVAKVDSPEGPTIDLFPAWIAEGRLFAWPWCYGDVAAEAVLPLADREVPGASTRVPAEPEALLAINYGPGWREPDPLFTFDWDAARHRFAAFVEAVETP